MKIIYGNFMLLILFIIGMGVLEYFLAKRDDKWPGRILPIFSFLYSLVMLLFLAKPRDGGVVAGIFATLILGNIPTVFFLIIYYLTRNSMEKRKKDDEMKKMKIQDL